ncbi:MAG TPA: dihydrolipoamide acetyltransferase family protein [Nitrospirota bacterium]|nr:dihydrolipoamide acetyltransferase family protein [Nitrospirota bacterium]
MAFNFVLPDLGEGIAEGEIRRWLVKEGSTITEHEAVLEIETDKAVVEVPSPRGGTVLKLTKGEGDTVKVGDVLIVIGEAGEKIGERPPEEEKPRALERPKSVSVVGELPEEEEVKPAAALPKVVSVAGQLPDQKETAVLAVPAVRAFAKEQGVSLDKVKGTGPGGSISREDVLKATTLPPKAEDQYGPFERVAIKGLRKTIAKNLVLAQKITAFVTETDEADITDLWDLRAREKKALEDKGVHLTFVPFFMKAIQHTLMEFGTFNASVDEQREDILLKKYFNIGVAVDTTEGLIVTVVKNVEKKTIRELAAELQILSKQARERTIKLEDLRGSTFTITNYGTYGSIFATPIINYPDVAILGTGKITDKPWVKGGQIKVRKILPLSLTFDHRVNDGAGAAKFLTKLVSYLEDPASIFIESA